MYKKINVVAVLVCCVMLFTACGNAVSVAQSAQNEDIYSQPVIINKDGREITFTQKPQKVLTLGPNCTELFIALGLSDTIVGTSLNNHSRGPLEEYAETYNNLPELTHGSATREAVLSSGADFIYGMSWEFGETGLNVDELEQYGIKVYQNNATTMDDIYTEINDLGRIFKIEETTTTFINNQKEQIEAIQLKINPQAPIKVLVYDSGNNGVFTATGANFESRLIELAGGKNIFDSLQDKEWATVSYEDILQAQPDIILIHDYDAPSVEEKLNEIKTNPTLSQLECVKNNHFATIELESVLPGDRMAYAVQKMYQMFFD